MILISHRGNINGPSADENKPTHIVKALKLGFDVEIDLWFLPTRAEQNYQFFLGHDNPEYKIDYSFILEHKERLWIHCKEYNALQKLTLMNDSFNYFYHTTEDYVLTSKRYIWAYPGKYGNINTICVKPKTVDSIEHFAGVCSDHIGVFRDKIGII